MSYTEREKQMMADWPVVTAADMESINNLFPHYLFYRHRKDCDGGHVELYASCCGRKERRPYLLRTESPKDQELMSSLQHKHSYRCPWCGKSVTNIDLSKAKGRKSLAQTELSVILHAKSDALYADACIFWKPYETEDDLTAKPLYRLSSGYRFSKGEVMQLDYQGYGKAPCVSYERDRLSKAKHVTEPFKNGSICWYQLEPYSILNREALQGHPFFRYCGFFDHWQYRPGGARGYAAYFRDFISYLTAYSIYPRQIEMLSKAGWWEPVCNIVFARKKNAEAMCWEETDPRKAFRIHGKEMHLLLAVQPRMEVLAARNYVQRHFDIAWSIEDATVFCDLWGCHLETMTVLRFLKRYRINPARFVRYLGRNHDAPFADLFELYKDYTECAYELGRCMEHSKVLWPDNLNAAHNEATAAYDKTAPTIQVRGVKDGKSRKDKYEFEADGLCILFPVTARQIQREGKALNHCVGGYAARHINNTLTILFLRRSDCPGRSLVTIEMCGNSIAQIHGWDNERSTCPENPNRVSPREVYKSFLGTWLKWLEKGSPRNVDGTPKITKQKNQIEASCSAA